MKELVFTPILASSKVPILVLISGYCYRCFPVRSVPPILSTLVELIEGGNESSKSDDVNDDIISEFFPSLLLILDKIEHSMITFSHQSGIDPKEASDEVRQVQSYLLQKIWSIDDIDSFYSFIKDSHLLLVDKPPNEAPTTSGKSAKKSTKPKKPLYVSSYLGKFVSSISLATEVLNFEDAIKLWDGFNQYRQPSLDKWKELASLNPSLRLSYKRREKLQHSHDRTVEATISNNLDLPTKDKGEEPLVVYSQVELAQLLEFQVHKLQIYAGHLPLSLRRVLIAMSESQRSIVPSSYYLNYLECWKNGDYEGSFDALHRYFDYMISNKQQLFYHYALLSLATLHSSFGSDEEALRAIDEAISVARENKDLDCLNYLLTWFFDFLKSRPLLTHKMDSHPGREQILQFLKLKTKENGNPILQSMAYQHEAVKQMLEGFPLRKLLNNITRAFYILLNLDSSQNTKMSLSRACQLAATIWSRVGVSSMAKLYIKTALELVGPNISIFDEVELALRKATIMYKSGDADSAFSLLKSYEVRVSDEPILMKIWQTRYLLLKADYWMKLCRFDQSRVLINKLKSQSTEVHDNELQCEMKFCLARFEAKVGNTTEAVQIISRQLVSLKATQESYNNYWAIRLQLLYSSILVSQSSSPERALSVLLNSIEAAHNSSLLTLVVEGALVLCELLLTVDPSNSIGDVYEILQVGMQTILEIDDLFFSSKSYYLMAKVMMLKRSGDKINDPNSILVSKHYLDNSLQGFRKLQDLEWIKKCLKLGNDLSKNAESDDDMAQTWKQQMNEVDLRIEREKEFDLC